MNRIVHARGLSKRYGNRSALEGVDLDIGPGQIVGLVGPNGAGKTTALKAILGLIPAEGELQVLGLDPKKDRTKLLERVAFIADTATLPRWIKVSDLLTLMAGIHPNFDIERARSAVAAHPEVTLTSRVASLSKGMITHLHLSLIMAIDATLLVLDEPTLGLDIIRRKNFYSTLLEEYFDHDKTILITTHQVEEVEHILTDVVFVDHGRIVLNQSMESLSDSFIQVDVAKNDVDAARALRPIYEHPILGGIRCVFERQIGQDFEALGQTGMPSLADLFVAKLSPSSKPLMKQENGYA